jgi:hypothetical protein
MATAGDGWLISLPVWPNETRDIMPSVMSPMPPTAKACTASNVGTLETA